MKATQTNNRRKPSEPYRRYKYKNKPLLCEHSSWWELDGSTCRCSECGSEIDVWVTTTGFFMDPSYHKSLKNGICNCCKQSIPSSQIRSYKQEANNNGK